MIPGLQTRVINLDRSPDRLARIATDLDQIGLEWRRLRAVEPDAAGDTEQFLYNRNAAMQFHGIDMTLGEIGCFASHVQALKEFLDGNAAALLVLEDDAEPDAAFAQGLTQSLDTLRNLTDLRWSCVNLAAGYHKRNRPLAPVGDRMLLRAYYFPILTAGLLWSRTGAQCFLRHVATAGAYLPVDQQLRRHLAQTGLGLAFDRPLLRLRAEKSTIDDRPTARRQLARVRRNLPNYLHAALHQLRRT